MPFRRIVLCCLALWILAAPGFVAAENRIFSRFDQMTIGPDIPPEACPEDRVSLHIQEATGQMLLCLPSALTYVPVAPTGASGSSDGILPVQGIYGSPTGINSIHYNTVTLTNTCGNLGIATHVNVTAGATGQTCVLPDASDPAAPGRYSIVVDDANLLTVAPYGSNTINGENGPLASIRGPLGRFDCERRSDTAWYCDVTAGVGYGAPALTSQSIPSETLTNSTTAEQTFTAVYSIPADFFAARKALCLTLANQYVSDAGPATIILSINLGATRMYRHATAFTPAVGVTRVVALKWCFYGTAPPGASVGVNTAPLGILSTWEEANNVTQPVSVATNGILTIVPTITYSTATGGESWTLLHAVIEEYN